MSLSGSLALHTMKLRKFLRVRKVLCYEKQREILPEKSKMCVLLLVFENEIPSPLYVMISITLSSRECPIKTKIKILWYLSFSLAAPAMMRTLLLATILSAAKQVTSSATVANSATFKRWCPCSHYHTLYQQRVEQGVCCSREMESRCQRCLRQRGASKTRTNCSRKVRQIESRSWEM